MNELIKVKTQTIGSQEVNAVDARELHYFLESRQDFSTWIKSRIEKYTFKENVDYLLHKIVEQHYSGAKYKIEYSLTIDTAKELAMVENNEKGRQARQYFIEIEKRYRQQKPLSIEEQTLNVLYFYDKKVKELETKVKEDAYKVELFDRAMETETTIDLTSAAKMLGLKPNNLFKELRNRGILYYREKNNVPSDYYMNMGYFELKETLIKIGEKEVIRCQPRLTQKGLNWLSKQFPDAPVNQKLSLTI